ncbi:hypothetical protein GCM10011344_20680 [Dokdonia pacifica]|uniref:Site-specific DNA recombinase n=1 Tax=Dokdonia pacifica TaxID=1627892 RepID=A0A238VN58_9FLAO|nr:recombinase family protein [Dokdonia pacifica]GGG19910.1 hypothetical protein GCM10011344_20680 [Dokdonia pacifica]SNR35604.1 Site-specific DNA recombinase [Dokdonia pacifica]
MYISTEEKLKGASADIYRRKSQEDKSRQILSLETQNDICDEIAKYWNVTIGENYSESKSAKTFGQRPQFEAMMQRIENGTTEVIVCWKIDRLVRNMREGGWVIDLLQYGKLKAIVTKDKVYLPEDNTIITAIEMASATEYSRELGKKVQDGNTKKVKKGIPNAFAIMGYLNNKHKLQGERDWRDDPERWKFMQQALRKILDDKISPSQAYKWLKEEVKLKMPIRKISGGKLIAKSSFYRFLRRPEVAGFFYYKGDKIYINDCITPMITEDEYWRIQKRLGEKGNSKVTKNISTYSNFIKSPEGYFCTPDLVERVTCDCKKRFSIRHKTKCYHCGLDIIEMKNPKFYTRRYYYNSYLKRNKIKTKGVPENDLDIIVLKIADHIEMDSKLAQWSQQFINDIADQELNSWQEKSQRDKYIIDRFTKKKSRIKEAFIDGIFSKEEYQQEIQKIDAEIALNSRSTKYSNDWKDFLCSLIHFGSELKMVWKTNDVTHKRNALKTLRSNFIWDEKNLSFYGPKWLNYLINGLNSFKSKGNQFEPKNHLVNKGDFGKFQDVCPNLRTMWQSIRTTYLQEKDSENPELVKIILP